MGFEAGEEGGGSTLLVKEPTITHTTHMHTHVHMHAHLVSDATIVCKCLFPLVSKRVQLGGREAVQVGA